MNPKIREGKLSHKTGDLGMNFSAIETTAPRGFLTLDNYANLSAAHPWVSVGATTALQGSFEEWLMVFILGANSSPSITFKLQQAKDVLGTGVKDVTGKSVVLANPAESNKIYMINCRSNELDFGNGYNFLRGRMEVTGGTTTQITGILFGFDPKRGVASQHALSEATIIP